MNNSVPELLAAAARGRIGVDQRLIRSITERGEAATPELLAFGLDDARENDLVGLELDLVNIFRILRTPEALGYYIHLVRLQPHDIEDELVEAFIEIGAPAVDPLLKLYEEVGEEDGGDIAFLLASLRVHDERIKKILLDRLEYDAWDGAICLGLYGDASTRPELEKALHEIADTEENKGLRLDLQRALDDLTDSLTEFTPQSPEQIIAEYPEKAGPAFVVLTAAERLELLASDDSEVRADAAESFLNSDLDETERERLFEVARNDPETRVRSAAWRSLSTEADDEKIYKAMVGRVSDRSVPLQERGGAIVGLALRLEEKKIRAFAEELYTIPESRAAALEAMRRSLDRGFAGYFPKHLADANPDVKREAIWGVGYLGIANEAERLKTFFEDEDFRADALFAYALCVRGDTSRGRMPGLLRKIDEAAGGLSEVEEEMVKIALDERLALHGKEPFFSTGDHEDEEPTSPAGGTKVGRNDLCPCGSGKKFKKCCGA